MITPESNIHFIVNPVSGSDDAPFQLIGQYMAQAPCKTTLHMTKADYSATDCVADALMDNPDLVVAYGGDGTVMEVANRLHGHAIPMAIIPGGTANIVAHELDIPVNTEDALELIFNQEHNITWIDAGRINHEHFLLRFSIGWEAELSLRPTTEDKSTFGTLAYTRAALQALNDLDPVTYKITLDDNSIEEVTGINCSICNIGNVGFYGISIRSDIAPDDGLLDVLILQNKNIKAMLDIAQSILSDSFDFDLQDSLPHYKAKKVTISPSSPQRMSQDGEAFDNDFPVTIDCVQRYISILTPKQI